jgi:hypothetical protein
MLDGVNPEWTELDASFSALISLTGKQGKRAEKEAS